MTYAKTFIWLLCALSISMASAAKKTPPAPKTKTEVAKPTSAPIQEIHIAYLSQVQTPPAALSNLDVFIPNKGEPGAQLAITDNNTTGQFTQQNFILHSFSVSEQENIGEFFNKNIAGKYNLILLNLPSDKLLALADLKPIQPALFFNVANTDDALRNEQCRANMLHLLPSRAMKADALAQYLLKKRWQKWFLVTGPSDNDARYAAALKRSAKRFGLKISTEKVWEHTFDNRRSEQADVPVFTQVDDYDVLVVADEQGLFGEYLAYRTWLPRPIVGTQGLIATAWHKTHDAWGATQIQNRFKDKNGRWMEEEDYGAYLAVRAIGEAASRSRSNQLESINNYLISDQLALQGYKGSPLSFRPWDGQLRQPVLLAADRSMVGVAPIEGFLHPKTELDTLGFDQPETKCNFNAPN